MTLKKIIVHIKTIIHYNIHNNNNTKKTWVNNKHDISNNINTNNNINKIMIEIIIKKKLCKSQSK